MPFPNVNSEFETLFEPTRMWLFGKPFKSIAYVPEEMWGMDEGKSFAADPSNENVDPDPLLPSAEQDTSRDVSNWDPPSSQNTAPPQGAAGASPQNAASARPQSRHVRRQQAAAGGAQASQTPRPQHTPAANEFKTYQAPKPNDPGYPELPMPPRRIERKLRQPDQGFARIYSFSFEGHYYRLPRPLLFLLSGAGRRPDEDPTAWDFWDRHLAFSTKFAGTAGKEWQFSDDLRVWAVDRKDLAVCLDVEIANYQELLLDSMIAARRGTSSRGDMVSRGDVVGRGDGGTASRGAGAGAFRGDMIGPHQNW